MPKNNFPEDIDLFDSDGGPIYEGESTPEIDGLEGKVRENILFIPLENEVFFPYMQIGTMLTHP
ncbi:MAG: hypothetical protein K2I45_05285, partial [Muribaculaceae bacterium]|nr:hypothetical protein [Muribaculaceae bacterium]